MKFKWSYIKAFLVLFLLIFLYSFSAKRNRARRIMATEIHFTNGENLYITENAVNKLLIVNQDSLKNLRKEILDLNSLEAQLDANPMIADADVYVTVGGNLGANITQRQPIARVSGATHFYIDKNGKKMPLSPYYSARVPWVNNVSEKEVKEVFPLLQIIKKDAFLQSHITSVTRLSNGNYELGLRKSDLKVDFGKVSGIKRKVNNFKAFYKKAHIDKKIDLYTRVNLQFDNQVVCTKK